jgi:undecaprenyl-diphosphatase
VQFIAEFPPIGAARRPYNAASFFAGACPVSDLLSTLLLGIIEGITEFLPVSSTGHLLIAEHWLGARSDVFNVVIQAGAILAVVVIYRERLWRLATGLAQRENRDYALKLAVSFLITAILGLAATKLGFKLPETITPVAWALIIGGFWMLAAEWFAAKRPESSTITWTVAILVGLAQVVAGVFPGTSRSAATIFVALLAGTGNRAAATEFAFLVGIPTMFAASGYELLKALKGGGLHEDWSALALAFVVSAITAFVAVRWLLGYIRTHRFTPFAIYRIALGIALLVALPAGG